MPKAEDILRIASGEVGTTEYPPNSNNVEYNTAFYGHAVRDGSPKSTDKYPWCCAFVWWVFSQFSPCLVKKTASCMTLGQWFKDNGKWSSTPQPGDVVFFKFDTNNRWTNHVGIVKSVRGNEIETIEGNTSVNSNDNGGAVMIRKRSSNIVGYGRPAYDTASKPVLRPPKKYKFGMDVSSYQGVIDFDKVKNDGIQFAILRSTCKDQSADPYFERNLSECLRLKIPVSVYKYSRALTIDQARAEAQGVIKALKGRKMLVWYDLEDKTQTPLGKMGIQIIANTFMTELFNAGIACGIYCNMTWYNNLMSDYLKNNVAFWIARYKKDDIGTFDESHKPTGIKNLYGWQYTSKGSLSGITGNVDLDINLM